MKGRGVMNLAYSRPLGVHSREGKNWLGIGGGGVRGRGAGRGAEERLEKRLEEGGGGRWATLRKLRNV